MLARSKDRVLLELEVPPVKNSPVTVDVGETIMPARHPSAPERSKITITGLIANLQESKSCVSKDSYLQLLLVDVHDATSTSPRYAKDERGRLRFDSGLPKASIASNGDFTFEADALKAGDYLIGVQLLEPGCQSTGVLVGSERPRSGCYAYIWLQSPSGRRRPLCPATVPSNPVFPLRIDIGELDIP